MARWGRRPRYEILNPLRVGGRKNALAASGYKIKQQEADQQRRLIQPWQARAFAYYDTVPELKYAASFYARALSLLRLYVGTKDEGGDIAEIENPSGGDQVEATQALERIQDPGGGRSGLLSAYGRLMFLIGEAYLFVSLDPDTEREQWEMLSPDELRVTGSGYTRFKAPSLVAENYHQPSDEDYEPIDDDTAVAYRLWRRHPRFSLLADSTTQGVLDVAEELVVLTQAVRARARSRLAGSGILIINGRISPPGLDSGAADENPDEDPFIADLTEAMTMPIVDEGAASAVVPLVVRTDLEDLNNAMKHIQLIDPTQLYPETGLRRECVERLAVGLDMPPEVLLGMGDINHWGVWGVDEHTWKAHLQPVAQQLVDDLTSAYFQPMLRLQGIQNWQDYCIAYDATAVINHPDRSKDAKDLYDRRAIGKAALRDAGGFDDEDAPTEEELWEMIGTAVRDGSLALFGIPSVKAGGIEPEPGELERASDTGGTVDAGSSSAEAKKEPPAEPTDETKPSGAVAASALAARIIGASELALLRTRELAGNRLRSLANKDEEAAKLIDGVNARDVPAVLGRERAHTLGAPPERELVAGAEALLADAIRLWGIDDKLAARLSSLLIAHSALHLYDEKMPPLPPAFQNYVKGLGA